MVTRSLPLENKSRSRQGVEDDQIKLPESPMPDIINRHSAEAQPTLTEILLQMRDEERY